MLAMENEIDSIVQNKKEEKHWKKELKRKKLKKTAQKKTGANSQWNPRLTHAYSCFWLFAV
jgi:hypothetical protein